MKSLNGKIACITGGSGGVAKALALALAREGCDLILVARTENNLREVAERVKQAAPERQITICKTDVSNPDQIKNLEETVRKVGRTDILINAAAIFSEESLEEMEFQEVIEVLDTIARGTILVTKAMIPYLKASQGDIVNLVTDWALPGLSGPTPFAAAKWAVAGMGESLSKELIAHGIRVVNIFPGDIASSMDPEATIEDVVNEHGNSMIPLADLVATILHVLKLEMSRIPSVVILPVDPSYGS